MSAIPIASTWVLLAILYGGGDQGADLRAILSAGDYINHAILTFDELCSALGWLQAAGCIEERSGRYFPTEVVLNAFEAIAQKRRAALKQWDDLEQFLAALANDPALPNDLPAALITEAQYEQALQDYLRPV
jgi:hypothetical protein